MRSTDPPDRSSRQLEGRTLSGKTDSVSLGISQILAFVAFVLVVYLSLATPRPLLGGIDIVQEFTRTTIVISGAGFLSLYAGVNLSKFVIARLIGFTSLVGIMSLNLLIVVTRSPGTTYQLVIVVVGVIGGLVILWDHIGGRISARIESVRSPSGNIPFGSIGLVFFGGQTSTLDRLANMISGKIQKASLKMSRFEYASSMVFWSILGSSTAGILGSWIILFFGIIPFTPLIPVGLAVVAGLGIFASFYLYPMYRSGVIKKKIDGNLAYTTNYLRILTASGATTERVFESLASVKDVFGVRDATRRMIRSIQLLGDDVFKAMDRETRMNPSRRFGEVLQGFVATARSGGDLDNYFTNVSRKQIDETKHDLRKVIDNLALAGEIYISGLVALPIVLVIILTISGLFGGEIFVGFSSAFLLQLIVYFMIPILAVSVLLMIDALAPRSDT